MKNLYVHLIYLSIIGILSFQLWSKTTMTNQAFNQIEQVLEKDLKFFDYNIQDLKKATNANIGRNSTRYEQYKTIMDDLKKLSDSNMAMIDKSMLSIKQGNSISIDKLNDSIYEFSNALSKLVKDKGDSLALSKLSGLKKFLSNDSFNDMIQKRPALYLNLLKNQIYSDELVLCNYILDKTTPVGSCGVTPIKLAIVPKKAVIIEGEKFEADLYLASYLSNPGSGLIITVNDESISIKEGIAHFKKNRSKIGLKTIKAQAKITNPATGETTTINSEFEYHVLPKCSKDCQ